MYNMEDIQQRPIKEKVALFPGSFDPFTIGHASLVARALTLADKIVIAIGINQHKSKQTYFTLEQRIAAIRSLYQDEPRVEVCSYTTLTADLAQKIGASFIIRGIRSAIDFEYEKVIADVNRSISGIETLFLLTEPEYAHVCSCVVRELLSYQKDVSMFLPKGMNLKLEAKDVEVKV